MPEQAQKDCYDHCNEWYSPMQPERLFCKKGCDSQQNICSLNCKTKSCNKVCIKQEQGDQKLFFNFLYRAPRDHEHCLSACIFGCTKKTTEEDI